MAKKKNEEETLREEEVIEQSDKSMEEAEIQDDLNEDSVSTDDKLSETIIVDVDETLSSKEMDDEVKNFIDDSFTEVDLSEDKNGEEISVESGDKEEKTEDEVTIDKTKKTESSSAEKVKDSDELDDDEEYLLSQDKLKFKDDDMVIMQQFNNVVTWEIDGLYKKDGKIMSKRVLRREPPIFRISSSDGDSADFLVTKDMSYEMYKTFETIYKAFFGLDARNHHDKKFTERVTGSFESLGKWAKKHPVKAALSGVLVIGLVSVMVLSFFS